MPDPNPSNRERLLRLIDGGTEALKEMQSSEPPIKPAVPATHKAMMEKWTAKLPVLSGTQWMRIAKWAVILTAIIVVLHYGLEMMKTMKQPVKPSVSSASSAPTVSPEDETGTGLRLVGVDTSDAAPVALLEDMKTGKTYFARVNEKIKGVRVKQIQKNKVVVSYHGKNVELR